PQPPPPPPPWPLPPLHAAPPPRPPKGKDAAGGAPPRRGDPLLTTGGGRAERVVLVGLAAVLVAVAAFGARSLFGPREARLPAFDPVPAFSLTAGGGAPLTLAAPAGRPRG